MESYEWLQHAPGAVVDVVHAHAVEQRLHAQESHNGRASEEIGNALLRVGLALH